MVPGMKSIGSLSLWMSCVIAGLTFSHLTINNLLSWYYVITYVFSLIGFGALIFLMSYTKRGETLQAYLFSIMGSICAYANPLQFSGYVFFTVAMLLILDGVEKWKIHASIFGLMYIGSLGIKITTDTETLFINIICALSMGVFYILATKIIGEKYRSAYLELLPLTKEAIKKAKEGGR